MKISKTGFYVFAVYAMMFAYMSGPALSYLLGIPRIDNPLTAAFWLMTGIAFLLENKRFPAHYCVFLSGLFLMALWPVLHFFLMPGMNLTRYADLTFFMVIPCFAYFLYLIMLRHPDSLAFARRFLAVFVMLVCLPPLAELLTGFQFTSANELLAVEAGIIKGLFFNPNNLGTTALCTAPAVLFFFNLQARRPRDTLAGWLLFLLLGLIVFASASRTATLCFVLLAACYLVYRGNLLSLAAAAAAVAAAVWLVPANMVQDFLLSLYGTPFLENVSSRLYLFLFDLESDNSVSYRSEIYRYFWENPPFLLTGYGPKNFTAYFGGKISHDLAFENPHSFLIEVYLSFGAVSLAGFAAAAAAYFAGMSSYGRLNRRQRFFGIAAMVLFLVGGFIPSSIFRMPVIWLPCFMIFAYSACLPRRPTFDAALAAAGGRP